MFRKILQYLKSRMVQAASVFLILIPIANAYFEVALDPALWAAYNVACGYLVIYLRGITTKPLEKL